MKNRDARKTERFHQIPIFSNLAGPEVGQILRITKEIKVEANQNVFQPGDPGDSFFIVLEGRVETRYGEHLEKSVVNVAGDFVYIPPDIPHQPINLSDTEPARAIVARNDASETENVAAYDGDAKD